MRECYLITGARGCGKTTLAKDFAVSKSFFHIDFDHLPKSPHSDSLEKYDPHLYQNIDDIIEKGASFVIESSLEIKYLFQIIKHLKEQKYKLVTIYIYIESGELGIRRKLLKDESFRKELKHLDRVEKSFFDNRYNFWYLYKPYSNEWYMLNNSENSFEYIALGDEIETTINKDYLFEGFLKGID